MPDFPFVLRRSAVLCLLMLASHGCAAHPPEQEPVRWEATAEEQALWAKGDAARALGRHDEAKTYYAESVSLSKGAVRGHLELAALHRRYGEDAAAQSVLEAAYALNPDNVAVIREYAQILLLRGNTARAAELADKGLVHNPRDVRLLNVQGVALDRMGEHKAAQQRYIRAMEQAVTPAERDTTANNQILSLIASGDYDTAISAAQAYMAKTRDKAAMRQLLALAYGVKGETDKAYDLGLQDLNVEQVSENLRFYTQLREGGIPSSGLFVPAE